MKNMPKKWTESELSEDIGCASLFFARKRIAESPAIYSEFYNESCETLTTLICMLQDVAREETPYKLFAELLWNPKMREALRYLVLPFISKDDLETLVRDKVTRTTLKGNLSLVIRVRDIILQKLDAYRFPWIKEQRDPFDGEIETAIVSTAVLLGGRKSSTDRRSVDKKEQEESVVSVLSGMGLKRIPPVDIKHISDAPQEGLFCREAKLGDKKADILIGLYDRRLLAIECKVSNSATNSIKRINLEVMGKAKYWDETFGKGHIVSCAVVSGVFTAKQLLQIQNDTFVFWGHRLTDLVEYIFSTQE